ncbi:MAG: DUF3999 family protein [Planctomycetota bacterium]
MIRFLHVSDWQLGQMIMTLVWGVYAAGLLCAGFRLRRKEWRLAALALFALAALKLVALDMRQVKDLYRVLTFLVLGLLMFAAAYLYHRLEKWMTSPPRPYGGFRNQRRGPMSPRRRIPMNVWNRAFASFLIVVTAGASLGAREADLSSWLYMAPVVMEGAPEKGLVEVAFSPEVLESAEPSLSDLRLVCRSGTEEEAAFVPFVTWTDRGSPAVAPVLAPVKIMNQTFVPNEKSRATVDFGARALKNEIVVNTAGTNFRRRVMVEGSAEGESWQVLRKTAWLFRIGEGGGPDERSNVRLPENDFRFLRVTVFHAPDDPEAVEIRSVASWLARSVPPETVEVPVLSTRAEEDEKERVTRLYADLGFSRLPIESLTLTFADETFLRSIEISGRDTEKETVLVPVEDAAPREREVETPWRHLAHSRVFRFPGEEEDASLAAPRPEVRLQGRGCRYLRIVIANHDDAPLRFTNLAVRRLQSFLAFPPQTGTPAYTLYCGNSEAKRPEYDLAHFADRLRKEGVYKASLGPLTKNPLFVEKPEVLPWSERHKALLWTALLAVLAILAVLLWRQARAVPPNKEAAG